MAKDTIYVIGHKSPDTDTVCSAMAYATYLKAQRVNAIGAVCGQINAETKFVLEKFKMPMPYKLESASGKKLVLVDHNEKSQNPDGIEEAKIIEVIDHHKINFSYPEPIVFYTEPVGSTATLVAKKLMAAKFKITPQLAGILASAILSDTVVFKSVTTTKTDIEIAKILGKKARIANLKKFGIEIKKQKASLKGLSAEQIINSDFKEFDVNGKKFAIGQIEVVDLKEAKERRKELVDALEAINQKNGYAFTVLMVTDIMKEGSEIMVAGNKSYIEKAFDKKIETNSVYLVQMMSRKKDLLPPLMKAVQ